MVKRVLIPLPSNDFDPSECAIPWRIFKKHDVHVQFATPDGKTAQCDLRMIDGNKLGLLAPFLIADRNGQDAYKELRRSAEFQNPVSWSAINPSEFDGMILPGGHAPGMKEYLEAEILQKTVSHFFASNKPLGAICHGVVLVARSHLNGKSVLSGRKTTALLEGQEMLAWVLTRIWLGRYYRTYPQTVEKEVRLNLGSSGQFLSGPLPILRDSLAHLDRGYVVRDGNYLSARWPGDAHRFAVEFLKMLA
jgi:protease I